MLVRRPNLDSGKSKMPLLKKLFWLYFLLVRDPVALLIVLEAFRTNKWPARWSTITGVLAVMMVSLCVAQMVMMDNPWVAALYGLRSYLLPFPVAFIMGENLDREDLRKLGVFTLWILLPMTLLEAIQYRSSPDAFVNNGAYEGARQIFYVRRSAVHQGGQSPGAAGRRFRVGLVSAHFFASHGQPETAIGSQLRRRGRGEAIHREPNFWSYVRRPGRNRFD